MAFFYSIFFAKLPVKAEKNCFDILNIISTACAMFKLKV